MKIVDPLYELARRLRYRNPSIMGTALAVDGEEPSAPLLCLPTFLDVEFTHERARELIRRFDELGMATRGNSAPNDVPHQVLIEVAAGALNAPGQLKIPVLVGPAWMAVSSMGFVSFEHSLINARGVAALVTEMICHGRQFLTDKRLLNYLISGRYSQGLHLDPEARRVLLAEEEPVLKYAVTGFPPVPTEWETLGFICLGSSPERSNDSESEETPPTPSTTFWLLHHRVTKKGTLKLKLLQCGANDFRPHVVGGVACDAEELRSLVNRKLHGILQGALAGVNATSFGILEPGFRVVSDPVVPTDPPAPENPPVQPPSSAPVEPSC